MISASIFASAFSIFRRFAGVSVSVDSSLQRLPL